MNYQEKKAHYEKLKKYFSDCFINLEVGPKYNSLVSEISKLEKELKDVSAEDKAAMPDDHK